ncbi:MAG: NAD(+) synthase [Dehalococcoidia bacterium]|jgi:NAD+ synthase
MEQLANNLTYWIKEQVLAAKKTGTILGLSGGIDSAVVAVLCKRVFPDATLAVIMPCYSNKMDVSHAYELAEKFDIRTELVELEPAYDSLLKILPRDDNYHANDKLAQSNIKPRLRMTTLYYLATQLNYLVVGTGNRSEIAIGYCTKYGDAGVDLLPLGNLVKRQVKELAEYLEIPREIINKPPSAGLWEGQTDEGEMGLKYKELDRYLTTGEASDTIKRRIESMIAGSAHKRAVPQIPPF